MIDQDGLNSTSEISVTVLKSSVPINQLPIATFYYSPQSPVETDVLISFIDSSNDPDGNIVNRTWNLGDGTIMYGQQATHSYQEKGNYNVILSVLDNTGAIGSYTQKITVEKIDDGRGIPGFELILFFAALGLILIIEKRRQGSS